MSWLTKVLGSFGESIFFKEFGCLWKFPGYFCVIFEKPGTPRRKILRLITQVGRHTLKQLNYSFIDVRLKYKLNLSRHLLLTTPPPPPKKANQDKIKANSITTIQQYNTLTFIPKISVCLTTATMHTLAPIDLDCNPTHIWYTKVVARKWYFYTI